MSKKQKIFANIAPAGFLYDLPVLRVTMRYQGANEHAKNHGRVTIELRGEHLPVEKAATEFFAKRNYNVATGGEVDFFFSLLAGEKWGDENSAYGDTFLNWGEMHGYTGAELKKLREDGKRLVAKYLRGTASIDELLENTKKRWTAYYLSAEKTASAQVPAKAQPDSRFYITMDAGEPSEEWQKKKERFLATFINGFFGNCIKDSELKKILALYRKGSLPHGRGIPDLFVWSPKSSDWFFAEVKSVSDSLHADQYAWMEDFIQNVGQRILIFRIVPDLGK